ncbi:MAG TPA: hypothetical protein P5119_12060 [Candidatus Aminicenantes bacterium]|nr:hypothetical protein [Candidatus Aminicenantes bacterium]HRY66058.1 hypothetical protein [Candidatus Aminicenantes bacterium]HRZ72893.1 hypothetical protein [Candidatus Aminicenantes bacterium]
MRRSRTRALLAAMLIPFVAPPLLAQKRPAAAGSKEALAVVEQVVAAMGGRKALASIKDSTVLGTAEMIQQGLTVPLSIYQKGSDKLRVEIAIPEANMTVVRIYDGRRAWATDPRSGTTGELPDFMARQMAEQAAGTLAWLDPLRAGVTYALKPKASLEGRDYVVLERTRADGRKTTFYIDPGTSLPYLTRSRAFDQSGTEVDLETYATRYQKAGAVLVPYSLRAFHNGAEAQRITVTSVVQNTGLDDALFSFK